MRKELMKLLLFTLASIVLSCLVSIMVSFIVGRTSGTDLQMLAQVQAFSIPLGLAVVAWSIVTVAGESFVDRIRKLYIAIPQWVIFSAFMLNLLVASGEIALIADSIATGEYNNWTDHLSLMSMMVSSLAFCLLYGLSKRESGQEQAFSGRW